MHSNKMNTAARWVCSFAGAIALACGGQVETAGDSASTGGSGSVAGSAGRGGSDGNGGVAGSSGGVAGSSGGAAGSSGVAGIGGNAGRGAGGAMTGGAAGAGGAPVDVGTKMRQACAALQASGCIPDPANCMGALSSFAQQIASYGCVQEFVTAMDCVIATRAFCENMDLCSPAMEAMNHCVAPNSCSEYGSSDGSCGIACGNWAADCKPGASGRSNCECTQGPRAGERFVSSVCSSPNWKVSARAVCLPP